MANTAEIHIKLTGTNSKTIEKRAAALNMLSASVARLSSVGKALPSISTSANNFARGVQQAGGATEKMSKKVQKAGNHLDNFGNLFSRMVRIMAAFAIITAVTRAVTGLVSVLVKAPAQFELWNTQLRTLTGNATLAAQRMQLLQDVAIETPLELPDLFQGLTTLQAFNVEISDRTLPLITDLAAISGRTFQEAAEVVGKVIQGSAQAITRSLPTFGISPDEFKARAEELGSRADALFSITEERFKDFAKESALTTIGIVSNIKDAFTVIAAEAGKGLLVAFRPAVKEVFRFLETIRKDKGALRDFQEQLFDVGRSLVNIVETLKDASKAVRDFSRPVLGLIDALGGWESVLSVLIGLKVAAWGRRTGFALVAAFETASIAIKTAGGVISALSLAIRSTNPWVLAISTVVGAAIAVFTRWEIAQGKARRAAEELTAANALLAESIAAVNQGMMRGINMVDASEAQRVGDELRGIAVQLAEVSTPVGMTDALAKVVQTLQEAGLGAQRFIEARQDLVSAIDEGARSLIFDKALADLFALGTDYKIIAKLAREAADEFAALNVPSIGEIRGAGSGGVAGEQIDSILAAIQQIRNEFSVGLIDEEQFTSQLFGLIDLLKVAFEEATQKGQVDSAFTKVATDAQSAIDVITRALGDLAAQSRDVDQQALEAATQQIEQSRRVGEAATEARERFQALLTSGLDLRLQEIQADFALGTISETQFRTAITTLMSDIQARIAVAQASQNFEVAIELKAKLVNVKELLEPEDIKELSNPLENALRNAAKQATDAFSEVLGALISRPEGANLGDIFKRSIAGILNSMGDALIQAGIASEAFNKLIQGFGLPGVGLAAIAIGIGLKAFASALGNSVQSQAGGVGSATGVTALGPTTTGPIDFGTVSPQPSSVINLNINTIDAAGVSQFVQNNAEELGNAVVYVADRDRATAGEAFGVFTPAFGG